eukprot:scaffold7822_cov179-Ochromonas_danica.AAC.14
MFKSYFDAGKRLGLGDDPNITHTVKDSNRQHTQEDLRLKYLGKLVAQAFRSIPADKFRDLWNSEEIYHEVVDFLDNPDREELFFRESRNGIEIIERPTPPFRAKIFYLVKISKISISEKKIAEEVVFGDLSMTALEHMASLTQRVFNPFISVNKNNEPTWSDAILKDVRDRFDSFVSNLQITQGHVEGYTCLPLPHAATTSSSSSSATRRPSRSGEGNYDQEGYQQIHVLESAIIMWTKQIKNVLKLDPEHLFLNDAHPSPLAEVDFWTSKAGHLNSIFDQLQSTKVRRILKVLDQYKSTYNGPFAKLCKEVFYARSEANNIIKYLKPLIPWFNDLESEPDFENLVNHFPPIIHLILLVWKSSAYYNTPARLVILMREICNTLIRQAVAYLNGDAIFELVEAGETATAVRMLKTVLKVFGRFKTVYFEYKLRASVECPDNPWSVQNNAVFVRLDMFLERCHDILDFGQTIVMFSKLAKIEVGGTKGKTLTTSVAQIYADFNQAIDAIRAVGKGILDLGNKKFEEAFYEFRNRIKELDRRLGSVIVQGFEDSSTIVGRFRLLDSFDILITRPIVGDALEKKHSALIESIQSNLVEVQKIFDEYHANPIIAHNLSPIAGALTWSRSLRDRIELPIQKLKTLDSKILEREDTRDVIKLYTSLIGQLSDLDKNNIEQWGMGIEAISQSKLKNPLLAREPSTIPSLPSLLRVNFDPLLVKLLREVKYFLLLGLEVPATAMDIYQKVEIFRRQTGNLDLIVNMYNDIQTTLLPVERPLVKAQLDRVDKTLSQGIGEGKNKAKSLNWKSNVYGLADAMTSSLKTMALQFNPSYLESNNLPALLEIQVDLVDKAVTFIPEVGYVEGEGKPGQPTAEVVIVEQVPFAPNVTNNDNSSGSATTTPAAAAVATTTVTSNNTTTTSQVNGATIEGEEQSSCWQRTIINLDKFGEKIKYFLEVQVENIVTLLKVNGIAIDMPNIGGQVALDFLEHAKMFWDNTFNRAMRVKENIQPMQSIMLEGIRKEVKQFNANAAKFVKDFRMTGPFQWLENSTKISLNYRHLYMVVYEKLKMI